MGSKEDWKEGRALHRLNCDFCDSRMDRIREPSVIDNRLLAAMPFL